MKAKTVHTKDCGLSDAEICRKNGWAAGTRLSGVERGKREFITITAVGLDSVLAAWGADDFDTNTALDLRNWRRE